LKISKNGSVREKDWQRASLTPHLHTASQVSMEENRIDINDNVRRKKNRKYDATFKLGVKYNCHHNNGLVQVCVKINKGLQQTAANSFFLNAWGQSCFAY